MCILFVAINQHPDHPLIIVANRDEYYGRPCKAMHRWADKPNIVAGRDLQANGTWLGINQHLQFSAVTNFRSSQTNRPDALSRGELTTKYLDNADTFESYIERHHHNYNPFNFIYGDQYSLKVWDHLDKKSSTLSSGFHSISNGKMDDYWPKMSRGIDQLTRYISNTITITFDPLLALMRDATIAETDQLPDTGIDTAHEKALSPIFVRGEAYGTRTSTLLLFSQSKTEVAEYNYDALGNIESDAHFIIDASFFS